jgi:gas vesicle protein
MAYNKQYWDERKQDLEEQFKVIITDTYNEIERLIARKMQKQQELSKKLTEINQKEQEAIKNEPKVEAPKVEPEAVK